MKIIPEVNIKENLRKDRIMFAVRIIIGIVASILVADWLHIDFAPSTGVITLLTLDKTKKETFRKIALRIVSFYYTYAAAWIVSDVLRLETTLGFSIAIAFVTLITILLGWDITLSVNCVVLVQLFLKNEPFTMNLFINESMRVAIALLTAVIVNWVFNVRYDYSEEEKIQNEK